MLNLMNASLRKEKDDYKPTSEFYATIKGPNYDNVFENVNENFSV